MDFQTTVLGIAFLALIACIIVIAMTFMKESGNSKIEACPDYWTTTNLNPPPCNNAQFGCCSDGTAKSDADGTNCKIKCYNDPRYHLGTVSAACPSIPLEMDFSTPNYLGNNGFCAKQKWANSCGLTWDGITNGPTC